MSENQHIYNAEFFEYLNETAILSARLVTKEVLSLLPVTSVLDVGCGQGAWLKVWKENGVSHVTGVDGDYVNRDDIFIEQDEFNAHNLTKPFSTGKRYDLVTSFEVAEHIDKASADIFVETLTKHGDCVLFSAAVPGQGGETHVNEQPYRYWKEKFAAQGYQMYDFIRPRIVENEDISFWYRYNMFLFVKEGSEAENNLHADIVKAYVKSDKDIVDYSPFLLRIRKAIIRCVPHFVEQKLAVLNHRMVLRKAKKAKAA